MTKLSATMIVKNEEDNLPRCLESIKGLCDEIIVVDTGSKDKTVEIAKSFGAKVYHHPWENNFSLHRNQAFGYATGEWCLVIDADEEITIPDAGLFLDRLSRIPMTINALAVKVGEVNDDGNISSSWLGNRFFRSIGSPHYEGIVHNKVKYEGHCAGTDIVMRHYGYHLGPEKMRAKHDRTMGLLQERLEADPKDYNAMYYMAQMAIGEKEYDKTIYWALKCLHLLPIEEGKKLAYYGVMYFYLATAYLMKQDGVKAYPCLIKGLEFFPDDIDLNWTMTRYGFAAGDDDILYEYGTRYGELIEEYWKSFEKRDETQSFCRPICEDDVVNRTIYCVTEGHLKLVESWMETIADVEEG